MRRTIAVKQAIVTRSLYKKEIFLIRIFDMRRARSQKILQEKLDLLWDYYTRKLKVWRKKPVLFFGSGTKYNGRYISYTWDIVGGQEIVLAPGERNFYVLLHELAHALGPTEHGIKFSQLYHDLLQHETFAEMMSTPNGQEFLQYLKVEHPRVVRRAYRG